MTYVARAVRFRRPAASQRSQHVAGLATVAALAVLSGTGVLFDNVMLAFFAVGAGAGYSLSGSV